MIAPPIRTVHEYLPCELICELMETYSNNLGYGFLGVYCGLYASGSSFMGAIYLGFTFLWLFHVMHILRQRQYTTQYWQNILLYLGSCTTLFLFILLFAAITSTFFDSMVHWHTSLFTIACLWISCFLTVSLCGMIKYVLVQLRL